MWIFLSNAMLSIVEPEDGHSKRNAKASKFLLVRARAKGDIERVFGPGTKVTYTPERDYAYRALIERKRVANTIAAEVGCIRYSNFKATVTNEKRHSAYLAVWQAMLRFQYWLNPRLRVSPSQMEIGNGLF